MKVGDRVTTRHFGGYERVEIIEIDDGGFLVSRFSGQMTDYMPKDAVEKVLSESVSGARH